MTTTNSVNVFYVDNKQNGSWYRAMGTPLMIEETRE
jgi:hypothetical protein